MNKSGTDIQFAICGSAGDGTIASGDIMKRAAAARPPRPIGGLRTANPARRSMAFRCS